MILQSSTVDFSALFQFTLPETILEVVSIIILVVDLGFLRRSFSATRMKAACTLGALGCVASVLWLVTHPLTASFAGGPFSGTLLVSTPLVVAAQVGTLVLSALILLLGTEMKFSRNPGEFAAIVLLATTGMMLVAAARDLLIIFIALELLSLSLYILTAFAKRSAQSADAALKYYLFGGMSAAFMLFGFSYLYGLTGTTSLSSISHQLSGPASPLMVLALVMVAAGLGFKVAAVPFHLWAPDTYQSAPAPVTALIASGSKVASFALLVAFTESVVGANSTNSFSSGGPGNAWILLLLAMAAASIVLGNLGALAQTSVKRLLAYSAIAHAGYMLLGIAAHTAQSAAAVFYYALTYALTAVGAFAVIGIVERHTGSDRFDAFAGLSRRNPLLSACMLVYLLSLAGIPPLVGFWAKFNLFAAVLHAPAAADSWGLILVASALAASAISLYYYLQVLKRIYVQPPTTAQPMPVSPVELAILTLLTLALIALGLMPNLLSAWVPLG